MDQVPVRLVGSMREAKTMETLDCPVKTGVHRAESVLVQINAGLVAALC